MKKIILAVLLLTGTAPVVFAQATKTAGVQTGISTDPTSFKKRTQDFAGSMAKDDFKAAESKLVRIQYILAMRRDELKKANEPKTALRMQTISDQLTELGKDLKGNKAAILQLAEDLQNVYY